MVNWLIGPYSLMIRVTKATIEPSLSVPEMTKLPPKPYTSAVISAASRLMKRKNVCPYTQGQFKITICDLCCAR